MKANDFYENIYSLTLECSCVNISKSKWDRLMKNSKKANVYKINKLLKELASDFFHDMGMDLKPLKDLGWYNPYNYYRTNTHIIFVHSSIEYFFKIN